MKNIIKIFIIFFVIISCQNERKNQNNIKMASNDSSENINRNQGKRIKDTLLPNDHFIKLVKYIDSCNYTWDSVRIKKTYCKPKRKNFIIINKFSYNLKVGRKILSLSENIIYADRGQNKKIV